MMDAAAAMRARAPSNDQQPANSKCRSVASITMPILSDRWINQDIIVVPEPPQSHRPIQIEGIPLLIIDGSSLVSQSNDYSSRTVVTMRESHLLHCRVRAASRSLIHS